MEFMRDVVQHREMLNADDPWASATPVRVPFPPTPVDIFDTLTRQMQEAYDRLIGIELDSIATRDRLATDND